MIRSALLFALCAACTPDAVPGDGWATVDADPVARDRVRAAIQHSWDGYAAVAFGADELRPVSQTPATWGEHPLGLTIVDGWDTLHLAGLDAEADTALAWIRAELDVAPDQTVSAFETNIRVLGGLLAIFEATGDTEVLDKARALAERLAPVFQTPTGMSARYVNLATGVTSGTDHVPAADIGTWLIELSALSRATGDPTWEATARRALEALDDRRDPETGLMATEWDVVTGEPSLNLAQLGSGVDSALEYLLKGGLLLADPALTDRYHAAIAAAHVHLAETTPEGLWYGMADASTATPLLPVTGALACFAPGMFALDGDLDRATAHAEACFAAWEALGPLPDAFVYRGLTPIAANHELRPELAESLFYLFRRTGDPIWRERGLTLLDDWDACCRVDTGGYTTLVDRATRGDAMPSYWLAESLKYLLLLFESDDVVDLRTSVFNTEAHAFAMPAP